MFLVNQALEGTWFYFIFVTKLLQVSPKQSWLCPGLAWGALAPALWRCSWALQAATKISRHAVGVFLFLKSSLLGSKPLPSFCSS